MENKTETYIVLKPIAERFSRIANEITDDEIKSLIQSELRDQMRYKNFGGMLQGLYEDWIENNTEVIEKIFKSSLAEKLK